MVAPGEQAIEIATGITAGPLVFTAKTHLGVNALAISADRLSHAVHARRVITTLGWSARGIADSATAKLLSLSWVFAGEAKIEGTD